MSMKNLFLTHDMSNTGKKMNNLPVTGGTCYQNSGFLCMTKNNGKLKVESGK